MLALIEPCSLHPFNLQMFVLLFLAQLHSEYDCPLAIPDVYPSKTRFLALLYSGSILYSRKNISGRWPGNTRSCPVILISMAPGGGECRTISALILSFSPIFHLKTVRPLPTFQEEGHSLERIVCCDPLLPGKTIKLLVSTLSLCLYLSLVNRGLPALLFQQCSNFPKTICYWIIFLLLKGLLCRKTPQISSVKVTPWWYKYIYA